MLDVLTIKFYLLSKPVTPVKMAIMVLVGLVVALFGILLFLAFGNSPNKNLKPQDRLTYFT